MWIGNTELRLVTSKRVLGLWRKLLWLAIPLITPTVAQAHATERGFILLLPTDLYIGGGAAVVAFTFLLMTVIPATGLQAVELAHRDIGLISRRDTLVPSALMLVIILALIASGYLGSRDPLSNPLPLTLWTIWWVGLSFVHAILGNLWSVLHPWRALCWLLRLIPPFRKWLDSPLISKPEQLGYLPAIALFLAFAWLELVHPAPQDPALLANAVIVYIFITTAGILLFGERAWLQYGEIFSIFFRIVSWLAPFGVRTDSEKVGDRNVFFVTIPCMRLLSVGVLPLTGAAFILLTLSSVSFDGFSRTFLWLDFIGVNPLEYPGRSALIGRNTFGLIGVFGALMGLYGLAVYLGHVLARTDVHVSKALSTFVVAIVPIAFGYHFAHYLPELLLDSQFTLRALSDPFAFGWDLLGTRDMHVHASIVTNRESIELIWKLQVFGIVAAHVAAVAIAHFLALRFYTGPTRAFVSQIPMTILMIGYTMFGLWLLSTPAAG